MVQKGADATCRGTRPQEPHSKYGPEALAMPSRRRDAPASMDVGAKGPGMRLGVHDDASGAVWAASGRAARNASESWHQFLRSKT
jgi:hypothetical protein